MSQPTHKKGVLEGGRIVGWGYRPQKLSNLAQISVKLIVIKIYIFWFQICGGGRGVVGVKNSLTVIALLPVQPAGKPGRCPLRSRGSRGSRGSRAISTDLNRSLPDLGTIMKIHSISPCWLLECVTDLYFEEEGIFCPARTALG